jgi:C_GCAxxG_C_C family probable redox protein
MSLSRRELLAGACCAGAALALRPTAAPALTPLPDGADPAIFARERFLVHFNCTQAVLESLAGQSGLTPEAVTRLTTAFAAGMWNGLTCGAVTGAVMVLGLRFGRTTDQDSKAVAVTTAKLRELNRMMTDQFGNLACSALLGTDMATDQGVQEAAAKGLFKTKCPNLVEAATRAAVKLMA